MEYTVKVIFKKEEISNKEKADRLKQFQEAFVTAAVSYYSKQKKSAKISDKISETSADFILDKK